MKFLPSSKKKAILSLSIIILSLVSMIYISGIPNKKTADMNIEQQEVPSSEEEEVDQIDNSVYIKNLIDDGQVGITRNSGDQVVKAHFKKETDIYDSQRKYKVGITADTTFESKKANDLLDIKKLNIEHISNESIDSIVENFSKNKNVLEAIEFGIPNIPLQFSIPVRIEIPIDEKKDGTNINIQVIHEGEKELSNSGITMNSKASCTEGKSSDENNQATVKNGSIVFYTCSASVFIVDESGDITPTISGGVCNGNNYEFEVNWEDDTGSVVNVDIVNASGTILSTGTTSPTEVILSDNSSTASFDIFVRDSNNIADISTSAKVNPLDCVSAQNLTFDAVDDTSSLVQDSGAKKIDYAENDDFTGGAILDSFDSITVNGGTVVDNGSGIFEYTPPAGFIGQDTFTYSLCNTNTPKQCDTAQVTANVISNQQCLSGLYQVVGGDIKLLDVTQSPATYVNITIPADNGKISNSTGININDGKVYGIGSGQKIRSYDLNTGVFEDIYTSATSTHAGDMDFDNNLYHGTNSASFIYKLDVINKTSTTIPLSKKLGGSDMAYVSSTKKFYSASNSSLAIFDPSAPTDNNVEVITMTGPITSSTGGFGAAWITNGDTLYMFNNNSGTIYKINVTTGVSSIQSQSAANGNNDGMSCALANDPFDVNGILDYGDLPDSYNTLKNNSGAAAVTNTSFRIGDGNTIDTDGQPNTAADNDAFDDGVSVGGNSFQNIFLTQGVSYTIDISIPMNSGYVSAWIDWNQNGGFETNEKVISDQNPTSGNVAYEVAVPANAEGSYYARFRLAGRTGAPSFGLYSFGEIEDYKFTVEIDTDGDSISDTNDIDNDNDGIPDSEEGDLTVDTDGDGIPDFLDLDSDNDGIADIVESGNADLDTNGDGIIDNQTDTDGDGLFDGADSDNGGTGYNEVDTDNDGIPDFQEIDSDDDGIFDIEESGNGDKDTNGDGKIDDTTDTDNDGVVDAVDIDNGGTAYNEIDTNNDGTPDYQDFDSDGDGIPDSIEAGPNPSNPVDSDDDGVPDYQDIDSDNDGITDSEEDLVSTGTDTDGDGVDDGYDPDPNNPDITGPITQEQTDTDNDGTPDSLDLDADGDGILDRTEGTDTDGDGYADIVASGDDTDGDGLDDAFDTDNGGTSATTPDTDNDGIPNFQDPDSDGDRIPDNVESGVDTSDIDMETDTDGDGIPDGKDIDETGGVDTDENGVDDSLEPEDTNTNDISDYIDGANYNSLDSDSDGIPDVVEAGPNPSNPVDTDDDGIPDYKDIDSDNDGIPDSEEDLVSTGTDTDGDGIDDGYDPDPNNPDITGPITQEPTDTDNDNIPDYKDLDSDNDGIPDTLEAGVDPEKPVDTDNDGIPNFQDPDSDNDGILDSIESVSPDNTDPSNPIDTDSDGIPDYLDGDSDNDGILDVIEGGGTDANNDGVIDNCVDTDKDGLCDSIDGSEGGIPLDVPDTDEDGYKDFQDIDSDNDGIFDIIESGNGDKDTDGDGILDDTTDDDQDGIVDTADIDEGGTDPLDSATEKDTDGDGIPNWLDPDPIPAPIIDTVNTSGLVKGTGIPDTVITVTNRLGTVVCTTTVLPDGTWSCNSVITINISNYTLSVTGTHYLTPEILTGNTISAIPENIVVPTSTPVVIVNSTPPKKSGSGGSNPLIIQPLQDQFHKSAEQNAKIAMMSGCNTDFTDINEHWGEYYIEVLHCLNIVSGRGDHVFHPDENITRNEVAKIAVLISGYTPKEDKEFLFSDVHDDDWARPYISAGVKNKIITGYGNNTFQSLNNATRAEALAIFIRSLKESINSADQNIFKDIYGDEWYKNHVAYGVEKGIIKGYEEEGEVFFKPNQNITRAEFSKLAFIVLEMLSEKDWYKGPTE